MIELKKIDKYFFKNKKNQVHAIDNTSLELPDKGLVAFLGESGSGKTTLLNVIGGLDNFDSGELIIDGKKINRFNVDCIRNLNIGYVFQDYRLIDDLTVFDNVAISLKLCGLTDKEEIEKRVNEILKVLGLYRYRKRIASNLSGGERQRVGIARAIIKNPNIIICDEPTGNLDSRNSVEIMNIIKAIARDKLVILVTHETNLADFYADRIVKIIDGKVISDELNEPKDELDYEIDNTIYLKDINNNKHLELADNKVDIYYDDDTKLNVSIVIKNERVFIEANAKNIEVINNSTIELIDDHKKKIDKSIYEQYEFDVKPFEKKNKSIYSVGSLLLDDIKTLFNLKGLRLLIFISCILGGFIMLISFSQLSRRLFYSLKDYARDNETYIFVQPKSIKKREELLKELEKDEKVNYVIKGFSSGSYRFSHIAFVQLMHTDEIINEFNFSLAYTSLIDDKDIIYGRNVENDDEVVIDKSVYRLGLYDLAGGASLLSRGILSEKDYLDKEIVFYGDSKVYKVVGIVDKETPCIYLKDNGKNGFIVSLFRVYTDYLDQITIVNGRLPEKEHEVIVPYNTNSDYEVGDYINEDLEIVGQYKSDNDQLYLMLTYSLNDVENNILLQSDVITISTNDKDYIIKKYLNGKYIFQDVVGESKREYLIANNEIIYNVTVQTVIYLVVVLVEIYFLLKTSLLAKVREIGIYRSIGVKRLDIVKMYLNELFALVGVGALLGNIGAYLVLSKLVSNVELENYYVLNSSVFAVSYLINVVIIYIVMLIPVYLILRKYPAQILTRRDV